MNTFRQFLLFSSVFVSSLYFIVDTANASENILVQDQTSTFAPNESSPNLDSALSLNQIVNVASLRDVSPTDWAFEALRSLVERYGCIAGYPDSTFRGNRALSRYQFAAGLNACILIL